MGSVFLAVTGAETLYADMGHFGRRAVGFSWLTVAYPCLMLNYMGQGALLFAWMSQSSESAMQSFKLPTNRVVELGSQLQI